jgi:hypothetical protein
MGDRTRLRKLVQKFSAAMRVKLLSKQDRGWENWDVPAFREKLVVDLISHLLRAADGKHPEQWVDIANYAAFLWHLDAKVDLGE